MIIKAKAGKMISKYVYAKNRGLGVKSIVNFTGKFKNLPWIILRAVLVIGISFIILYPLLVKFSTSLMSERDLYDTTIKYVPKKFTLINYYRVFSALDYPITLLNTLKLCLLTSVMQIASCTLIGFGFARFKFKGREILFGLVLLTLIVPPQTILLPLYMHFRYFDIFGIIKMLNHAKTTSLLDSYLPFILLSSTGLGLKNGLYIYLIRQFFRGMPKAIEESASIDGAGVFKTFYALMLPNAKPIITTTFLFSFVWQWNDSFYSTTFLSKLNVLATMLGRLTSIVDGQIFQSEGVVMAFNTTFHAMINNTGILVHIIPLLVLYLFAQRNFVESIERSGIVG